MSADLELGLEPFVFSETVVGTAESVDEVIEGQVFFKVDFGSGTDSDDPDVGREVVIAALIEQSIVADAAAPEWASA